MKNLILVRHGKSSSDLPIKDVDRSLDKSGIKEAHLVAINCIDFLPNHFIICSSIAKRASETAQIFAANIGYSSDNILYKKELYTFDEDKLENIIKLCSNDLENIILFGHNAAITNFVNKFGNVFINNVPTAGFVSLQFNTDNWDKINKGKILKTIFPKDLK